MAITPTTRSSSSWTRTTGAPLLGPTGTVQTSPATTSQERRLAEIQSQESMGHDRHRRHQRVRNRRRRCPQRRSSGNWRGHLSLEATAARPSAAGRTDHLDRWRDETEPGLRRRRDTRSDRRLRHGRRKVRARDRRRRILQTGQTDQRRRWRRRDGAGPQRRRSFKQSGDRLWRVDGRWSTSNQHVTAPDGSDGDQSEAWPERRHDQLNLRRVYVADAGDNKDKMFSYFVSSVVRGEGSHKLSNDDQELSDPDHKKFKI